MANDGQKEKVGDDTPNGSKKHIDLDVEEDNYNEETRDKNHEENDKDRCLRRDDEMKGMANKLADLQTVVNFMMKNVMQSPFPLQDTSIPAANKDAQKGGKTQFLQSLSMTGQRGILTGLHGRSGMENQRGLENDAWELEFTR
ncbi:hypothetical protein ACSBR2_035032 [Camellia fascicularis]